jgi:DNA-binding LytR/AlgR family response regulator
VTDLRILCVDDEPLALRRLEVLVERIPGVTWVGEAEDADTALAQIDACRPDVVLLDIELGGASGLELAARLAGRDLRIVFVTAFPQFALEAFGVAATDYLLKPVSIARLETTMTRIRRELGRDGPLERDVPAIWVRARDMMVRLDCRDIEWVQAERDYVHVHCGADSYMLRQTLDETHALLGRDRFVRVHKSHLVRADLIRRLRKRGGGELSILLPAGHAVRVGRMYRSAIRAVDSSLPL